MAGFFYFSRQRKNNYLTLWENDSVPKHHTITTQYDVTARGNDCKQGVFKITVFNSCYWPCEVQSGRPAASLSLTSCCLNLTRLWGAEWCRTLLSMGPAGSHWPHPPPCPPAPPVDSNMRVWGHHIYFIISWAHALDPLASFHNSSL